MSTPNFPTFRIIKLGTGLKTGNDFCEEIRRHEYSISNRAVDIMNKEEFTVAEKEIEVELVVVSVAELGFKDKATLKDIYDKALSIGLRLCPAEVGPRLRLDYYFQPRLDDPGGKDLHIAMEPITDSDGFPRVLNVLRTNVSGHNLWLSDTMVRPDDLNYADSHWVFCRGK